MSDLEKELEANYQTFRADWISQAAANQVALASSKFYRDSYRRIACLQAMKADLVSGNFSPESAAFFLEAQNDALVSHVSASSGAWRPALQSLRSCIENVLNSIFYNEHPVELLLWKSGRHKMTFTDLHKYFVAHPALSSYPGTLTGLVEIKNEYATLSKAVHASAANFRMTDGAAAILLWSTDASRASMWSTRERKVIQALCLLMCCLNKERLQGTKLTGLRQILYFSIGTQKRAELKKSLKISIQKP
ncbi:MAG: hypothetical protein ABJL17_13015 [Parvibaculum sp.]|uniref:hypothetical protein n=1 Tax=Parvibaculum sp. TaxID=2024848 RepID=UPI0032656364